ncbi:hypothetical protein EYF80_043193 [Liparis tanakae]|uniref:Uncharacterized protein n=1 Tax=Liparis tanakae TaxID=230148 RepID=A0A4Z2FZ62_9TELE|nr:hypothetical protein EYF80_043193 [Liparis tanakae]
MRQRSADGQRHEERRLWKTEKGRSRENKRLFDQGLMRKYERHINATRPPHDLHTTRMLNRAEQQHECPPGAYGDSPALSPHNF